MSRPLLPDPTADGEGRQSVSLPGLSAEGLRSTASEAGHKEIPAAYRLYKTFAREVHVERLDRRTTWSLALLQHVGDDELYGLANLERLRLVLEEWDGDLRNAYRRVTLGGVHKDWDALVPVADAVRRLVTWGSAAEIEAELDVILEADAETDLMDAPALVLRQIGLEWSVNCGGIEVGALENLETSVRRLRVALRVASSELDVRSEDVVSLLRSSDPDDIRFGCAHVRYVSESNWIPRDLALDMLQSKDPDVRGAANRALAAGYAPEGETREADTAEGGPPSSESA